MAIMALSAQQDAAIAVAMRVCGTISLLGCLFIVLTFALSKRFRRPVNRLIFYASWGNMVLAIMGILSVDPIFEPYGPSSSLCTAQGFMIQMFLPSDALWNLAMAINVYLTIFKRWEVERMKRLEIWYAAFNFGVPFIIALSYVFVNDATRGKIYGPAAIWCWITSEWEWLRIALLYAPSWVCIVVIFIIYVAAGLFIYEKRRGLNSARMTPPSFKRSSFVPLSGSSPKSSDAVQLFTSATKTTQIKVTSEPASTHELVDYPNGTKASHDSDSTDGRPIVESTTPGAPPRTYEPYTVTINGGVDKRPLTPNYDQFRHDPEATWESIEENDLLSPTSARHPNLHRHLSGFSRSPAVGGTPRSRSRADIPPSRRQTIAMQRQQTHVAWGYTKVALLYFISLLSTWVPSSVNRVYSLVHENEVNFGLSMAAAFVLPLVGFWNALIYAVTSWDAVREIWWEGFDWVSGQSRGRTDERSRLGSQSMHGRRSTTRR